MDSRNDLWAEALDMRHCLPDPKDWRDIISADISRQWWSYDTPGSAIGLTLKATLM
ncbi:hypothetical protein [Maritalea sp.]|jgi:hypothetical protein|uniref:hypothetical protein n=1 Tax=Maritalea sp. TaxID=2003361 RepID=UPI0039E4DB17